MLWQWDKQKKHLIIDEVIKSRHLGENRGPVKPKILKILDAGFRRHDEKEACRAFCLAYPFAREERPCSLFLFCV